MVDRIGKRIWLVAAGAVVLRAVTVAGLELYSDEAYYWLWSRRLDFGYFDHPPMVAWLARLSSALFPGELGLRFVFLLCGGLAVVFAGLAARELSPDPRAPVIAAALAAVAPLLAVTGALALPDAPVEAAYAAATYLLARARGGRWAAAGVAVGLALLSKYTAALLAPALLVLVLWDRELRAELRTAWPWIGAGVAIVLFAPVLIWNARHDFVSIRFQMNHGFGRGASLASFASYLGGQLLGVGPVAMLAGVAFLVRARDSAARRVAAATLIPLLVMTYSAARGPVEANWACLVYPGLCAAAGAGLAGLSGPALRWLVGGTVALAVLVQVGFALEERTPRLIPPNSPVVNRIHGWREFALQARARARQACAAAGSPAGCDPEDPMVVPSSYQVAGMLAYYGGWLRLAPAQERPSQLDLWADWPRPGAPFLHVGEDGPDAETRRRYPAAGEGPTLRWDVAFRGQVIRRGAVTVFSQFLGVNAPVGH
jgi:4-amino-4-deoxy-L-arabinose transferase-like glycosyltransferase